MKTIGMQHGQNIGRVGIFETDVLGAVAYHARCFNCGWETRRADGRRGEIATVDKAKAHGAECPALREQEK